MKLTKQQRAKITCSLAWYHWMVVRNKQSLRDIENEFIKQIELIIKR